MSYFPLDREILTSSIWSAATPAQLKVWLYLLLAANPRDGIVRDTVPAIAQRCGLPIEEVEEALNWLASPDRHSRTRDHDGRRIARTDEGIQLLTYLQHRDRDYSTPRVQRFRDRQKQAQAASERDETKQSDASETASQEDGVHEPEPPLDPKHQSGLDWVNSLPEREQEVVSEAISTIKRTRKSGNVSKSAMLGVLYELSRFPNSAVEACQIYYRDHPEKNEKYLVGIARTMASEDQ